ncbi:MAG: MerR family transcriptional regulator [Planctomycetota bacterium]|jgi:DNA-binding transcriptional MerR regulator
MAPKDPPEPTQPLFSISVASDLTEVSPVMIREYEKAGFIRPARVRGKRRFSHVDIANIQLIRHFLQVKRMTLKGLKVLFQTTPCYSIKKCQEETCPLFGGGELRCWEVMKEEKNRDPELCKHCPVYFIRTGETAET